MDQQNTIPEEKGLSKEINNAILKADETAEDRIASEVTKFDFNKEKIAQLKQEYSVLKVLPLPGEDASREEKKKYKSSYEAVKDARSAMRTIRTSIEKKRKHLKDDYVKIGKGIDNYAKDLTILVTEIEDPLAEELERADQAEAALQQERERKEKEMIDSRVNAVVSAGAAFDGSFYSIKNISLDIATLKSLTDNAFDNLLLQIQKAAEEVKAEKEEKERREREEQEERERVAREQEEERLRLENERAELERQKEQMRKEMIDLRIQKLKAEGFIEEDGFIKYGNGSHGMGWELKGIENMDNDSWPEMLSEILKRKQDIDQKENERLENIRKDQEEKQRKELRLCERINAFIGLGMEERKEEDKLVYIGTFSKKCRVSTPISTLEYISEEVFNDSISEISFQITKAQAEEDAEKIKDDRFQSRVSNLIELGLVKDDNTYSYGVNGCGVLIEEIKNDTEEEWSKEIDFLTESIKNYNIHQKEVAKRKSSLIQLGFVETHGSQFASNVDETYFAFKSDVSGQGYEIPLHNITTESAEQWAEVLEYSKSKMKEIKELDQEIISERERKAEAERLATLSDAEKITEWLNRIANQEPPVVSEDSPLFESFTSLHVDFMQWLENARNYVDSVMPEQK